MRTGAIHIRKVRGEVNPADLFKKHLPSSIKTAASAAGADLPRHHYFVQLNLPRARAAIPPVDTCLRLSYARQRRTTLSCSRIFIRKMMPTGSFLY